MIFSTKTRYYIANAVAVILCVVPSAVTVVQYFPVWKQESYEKLASGVTVSAISVLLLIVSSTPLINIVRQKFKTPSAWGMWLIAALICHAVKSVIDDLEVICVVSALGSLAGHYIFIYAKTLENKLNVEKLNG